MLPVKLILSALILSLFWGISPHMACQKSSLQLAASDTTEAFAIAHTAATTDTTSSPKDTFGLRMLALGDSYTIGESVTEADRYPLQVVNKLSHNEHIHFEKPEIIATTGWTTGNLLDALTAVNPAGPYHTVTLLIGVNNQFQGRSIEEYSTQLTTLIRSAIVLAGNQPSHVLILSIPDYSVTPFGRSTRNPSAIATQIDAFNQLASGLAKTHKASWLDITAESRKAAIDPTLIAADGLHFSGKEYEIWARLMEPVIKGMIR